MDITPPQEMTNYMKSPNQGTWRWMAMPLVVLLVGWLWISWRSGWFPFGTGYIATEGTEQRQANILNSLTASASVGNDPGILLKQLTPSASTKNPATNDGAVLGSLTAKE